MAPFDSVTMLEVFGFYALFVGFYIVVPIAFIVFIVYVFKNFRKIKEKSITQKKPIKYIIFAITSIVAISCFCVKPTPSMALLLLILFLLITAYLLPKTNNKK
jgi:hypothetical protein